MCFFATGFVCCDVIVIVLRYVYCTVYVCNVRVLFVWIDLSVQPRGFYLIYLFEKRKLSRAGDKKCISDFFRGIQLGN